MEHKINVNPQTLKNILCICGNKFFTRVSVLKLVPKFMAGTPVDAIINVDVWSCSKCEEVLPLCLPAIKEPETPTIKIN